MAELAAEMNAHQSRYGHYNRSRAAMLRAHPELERGTLLREAEEAVRQLRAHEANQARQRGGQAYWAAKKTATERLARAAAVNVGLEILAYGRTGETTLGVQDTRYEVRFVDPFTGQERAMAVYLPVFPGISEEAIAARIAAAVMDAQGQSYDQIGARYYQAIREGTIASVPPTPETR